MPNGERISDQRFREWEEALAPYRNDVEEFAREKGLQVKEWFHDFPIWLIGRTQKPDDLNKIWWNIQLGYSEREKNLALNVAAWIDAEYDVPDGLVRQRTGFDSPKNLVATWKKGAQINIKGLLEEAYQRVTFTEQVSASITGEDGITRAYNPQFRSQA